MEVGDDRQAPLAPTWAFIRKGPGRADPGLIIILITACKVKVITLLGELLPPITL